MPSDADWESFDRDQKNFVADVGTFRVLTTQMTEYFKGQEFVSSAAGGVCMGDSGGPAFVDISLANGSSRLTLVGIATRGDCRRSSIHTDLRHYRSWVARAIESLKATDVSSQTSAIIWSQSADLEI